MTRVGANDEKFPVPSHQLTVFTDSFNARTHLHANTPETITLHAIFVETSFLQKWPKSGKGEKWLAASWGACTVSGKASGRPAAGNVSAFQGRKADTARDGGLSALRYVAPNGTHWRGRKTDALRRRRACVGASEAVGAAWRVSTRGDWGGPSIPRRGRFGQAGRPRRGASAGRPQPQDGQKKRTRPRTGITVKR